MPLSAFQQSILRLLAQNRSPESYVAGATVLHQIPDSPRFSEDLDMFHDVGQTTVRSRATRPDTRGISLIATAFWVCARRLAYDLLNKASSSKQTASETTIEIAPDAQPASGAIPVRYDGTQAMAASALRAKTLAK